MLKSSRAPLFALGLGIALVGSVHAAGQNVSSVTTTTTTGTATTVDGLTYDNTVQAVTGFGDALGVSYTAIGTAPNAFTQRANTGTNANQSSVWYAINSSTGNLAGVNQTSYPAMLKSNNLLEGADNVFSNGTAAAAGNIERLDYTWGTSFASSSQLAFAVFERGVAGAHDAFTIAIVTAVNPTTGAPTAYGGFLKIAANWGGANNLAGNPTNQLLRYNAGDSLTSLTNRGTLANDTNTQGVGGIVLRASEFGLADGTPVYGYSLMGADVAPGNNPNALLDVTNTTVYPTNTADANGGIDLAALNGIAFRAVPEPSTFAALAVGLGLTVTVLTRRRRRD